MTFVSSDKTELSFSPLKERIYHASVLISVVLLILTDFGEKVQNGVKKR